VPTSKLSDPVSVEVARLLRKERVKRRLSINQLAHKAGLSRQMVSYIEQDKRNPSLDTLLRLTRGLQINLDELIRRARRTAAR